MNPEILKQQIAELLSTLGVTGGSIDIENGHRTVVRVTSEDPKILIGPHGEHLRALNTLARRLVETRHGEESANFLIDVNNYHEDQLEHVRSAARMLAQRARLFKHDVEMEPLSSYERLVVHELFAEDPEIKTVSEGEGKFRHIVLKYRSTQSTTV